VEDLTVDEFRKLVSEFSDPQKYPDAQIQVYIDLAIPQFNHCVWGYKLKFGEAMLVAHWMAIADAVAKGKLPVYVGSGSLATSKKVGDTAIGYSDVMLKQQAENPYMRTLYGQQYWFMVTHLSNMGMMVV
jgi:Protein of unknown function (DUF4054)